ncbi:MAG: LD-carboxypeptidase [Paludibacteraceae bacterium]|nr:LD-carboxypeptidase [Paludibacteraceae bacterium]
MKHIHILSPSGAIDPSYIDGAAARLRSWGFRVSEGEHARGCWGRFSGTDDERLADLTLALQDPSIDYILCSRGGYGLQRILSRLSPLTSHHSPSIIGFSDITELHQWSLCHGQASLHGLMCKHLTELPEDSEMIANWRKAIENQPLTYDIPVHKLNRPGSVTGTLIGGNLSVLYGLQATPFQLSTINVQQPILFIEDIAERHYHIDRMMQNLKMSGVLSQIKGLIVGQFSDCEDDSGMHESIYETIRRAVEDYDYPVLFDFPAGHVERNMPLWMGKPTTLKVSSSLCILQQ